MPTINEQLQSAAIGHQVDLQQFSASVVKRIMAVLNKTDKDLMAKVRDALDRYPPSTVFSIERLDAILGSVRAINAQAYAAVGVALTEELRGLTQYEGDKQALMFHDIIPTSVNMSITRISVNQVYAAAVSRPFQGRLLSEWMDGLETDRADRIRDAVRMGFVEGETVDQIVRRIRGTREAQYADGLLAIDRRNAEAVARTAISHIAAAARDEFFSSNNDLIKAVVWSATLDLRTSEGCRIRDGKHYHPVTHKPMGHSIPWLGGPGRLHWRCRSASYPITKSWKELGIDMAELDVDTRASMDGQVPADLNYGDWLRQQSASRQDEIVGPTRGRLMRAGKLDFDAMYTNRGEALTLPELYKRHADAFKRAGISVD